MGQTRTEEFRKDAVRILPAEQRLRAYSVEKLQYLDFENFRQKHTFAETHRGLPRKAPGNRNSALSPF